MILHTSPRVFFVPSSRDVLETLFTGPTTASGTFKLRKNGILISDLKGAERVFICCNPTGDPFFVSCSRHTGKDGKRRLYYMQALTALDELWLDVRGLSWAEERALAAGLWAEARPPP